MPMFFLATVARPGECYAIPDADEVIWRKPFDIATVESSTLASQSTGGPPPDRH